MANHVETYVSINNIDKTVKQKLQELCEVLQGHHQVGTFDLVNRLYVGDFTWDNSLSNEENTELGNTWPSYDWMIENIGSKWVYIEHHEIEDDYANINFVSAWSFPEGLIQKLTDVLTDIKEDVYLSGTYEDEGLDPVGVFVWAKDFDDIEDFDHDYDTDKVWEDDEVSEKFYDELNELKQEMIDSYVEFIEYEEE